jgi:hypothetical protein
VHQKQSLCLKNNGDIWPCVGVVCGKKRRVVVGGPNMVMLPSHKKCLKARSPCLGHQQPPYFFLYAVQSGLNPSGIRYQEITYKRGVVVHGINKPQLAHVFD